MESWEALLDGYDGAPDIAGFSKVMLTAETVLKEDLAAFEIEWIASTLLFAPISVLELIIARQNDGSWSKPLSDAFKIISTLMEKYPDSVVKYHDDIVKACQLPLEARARGAALQCLAACAARSLRGLSVPACVSALHAAAVCKAPLAALLGAICEYHPEAVEDHVATILRAFLNLLEVNNVTDAVRCAALRGVSKLLRHYGPALLLTDLQLLYAPLARLLPDVPAAAPVILEIYASHAALFRERLVRDAALRRMLWAGAEAEAGAGAGWPAAILAVYTAAFSGMTEREIQSVLEAEVSPRVSCGPAGVRLTALRVLRAVRARSSAFDNIDVFELEFKLRTHDKVAEDVAQTVLFCVESALPHSGVLLQTAVLNHERLPAGCMRDILAAGLDNDPDDEHLYFLITESSRPGGLQRHAALWGALPRAHRRLVRYLARALGDAGEGEMADSLVPLLQLAAHVLGGSDAACDTLAAPLCAFIRRSPVAPALLLLPLLPADSDDVVDVYRMLDVEMAADEECTYACALALLHAPRAAPAARRLAAAHVVLSRWDAEPAQLRLALLSLGNLLADIQSLDPEQLAEAMRSARRLRARTDLVGREARELQRDLLMFLGEHWDGRYESKAGSELDALAVTLRDHLSLDILELNGKHCKIYLKKILPLAVECEDLPSLEALAAVICAHPECGAGSGGGGALRGALAHVTAARARLAARGAAPPPPTPAIPALAPLLLKHIARGTAGERRVLCRVMSPLLQAPVLRDVAEGACDMLATGTLRTKLAALDAIPTLLKALSKNSIEARDFTPRLLLLIASTNQQAAIEPFKQTSTLFLDMRGLFGADALNNTANDLILLIGDVNIDIYQTYKDTVAVIVDFLKNLLEDGKTLVDKILLYINDDVRCIYVLAVVKKIIGFDLNPDVAKKLFECKGATEFEREAGLMFVTEFADALLKNHYEQCLSWVRRSLASLPAACGSLRLWPACVAALHASLGALATLRECGPSLEAWTEGQPIQHIAEAIRSGASPAHRACVSALRALLAALSPPHPAHLLPAAHAHARSWPAAVAALYNNTTCTDNLELPFLSDALAVGLRFCSADDIKALLLCPRGDEFCKDFMPPLYRYLTRPPFLLCEPDMRARGAVLRHILSHAARDGVAAREHDSVLLLADELWETFAGAASAAQCGAAVAHAARLGAGAGTWRGARWAVQYVADARRGPGERGDLLYALPDCQEADAAVAAFCREMPVRFRECRGPHARALRGVLDAAAATPRPVLLDLLDKMAAGEEAAGWWEGALEACMASLAARADAALLAAVWRRASAHALSAAPTARLLAPLISNSPPPVCEEFYRRALPELLAPTIRAPSDGAYHRSVVQNTRRVILIRLMAEKVPRASLSSPSSALHGALGTARPWHAVREACKLCVALQRRVTVPAGAGAELERDVRLFQQHAYAAMCALALAWRCDERLYGMLLHWEPLVGDEPYHMPIRTKWSRGTVVTAVAGGDATSGGGSGGGSSRPRVFLRTLSECPLNFDLFDVDEECERVELVMSESPLNRLPAAGPLSQLLRHLSAPTAPASTPSHTPAWLTAVCDALRTARTNVRWLLAQCIVNVRESLSAHSAALAPAMLAALLNTSAAFNQLHVDILETVAAWGGDPPPELEPAASILVRQCATQRFGAHRALLQSATALFKAFPGTAVEWDHLKTMIDSNEGGDKETGWRILLAIAKAGAALPGLVTELLDRLAGTRGRHQLTELSKLFGAVMSVSSEPHAWAGFHAAAGRVRAGGAADYVGMLYHAGATDLRHFTAVADFAQKMPSSRKQCVAVLAAIVSANKCADRLADLSPDLAAAVWDRCADLAFEEMFSSSGPPAEKRARLSVDSALLATRENAPELARILSKLTDREEKIDGKLSDDMAVRFVECFYVHAYLPAVRAPPAPPDAAGLMTSLLRKQRYHQPPLPPIVYATEDTDACNPRVGTLRTHALSRTARSSATRVTEKPPEAALTIEQALTAFINFGKSNMSVAAYLCAQLYCLCAARAPAGVLAGLLAGALAPRGLRLAAELAPALADLHPLSGRVSELSAVWADSEAAPELRLLRQELRLRSPSALYVLGVKCEEEGPVCNANEDFTIDGLVRAFGTLSNWATLTLRERRRVVSALPPLWTSHDDFRSELDNYAAEGDGWFSCMVRAYRGERNDTRWLRVASSYPGRQFHLSAVTEAVRHVSGTGALSPAPSPADCLAEWAARLMIRSLYLQETMEEEEALALSRSHELQWCRRATEMGLADAALQCIRRNTREELLESETLAWLCARARAARARDSDGDMAGEGGVRLRRELDTAESHGPSFYDASPVSDVIEFNLMLLLLRKDLELLTDEAVDGVLTAVEHATSRDSISRDHTESDKDRLREICETAVLYYDDTWDDRDAAASARAVCRAASLAGGARPAATSRVLRRVARATHDATGLLADTLSSLLSSLPAGAAECARSLSHAPSPHDDLHKLRRCLQLLCGAEPTLLQHITELANIKDAASWSRAFLKMKAEVFENELAGADYHALHQHKRALYTIQEYEDTAEAASVRRSTLHNIASVLRAQPRARRSVRALCPSLSDAGRDVTDGLEKLLGLSGVKGIDDEIRVFTDAVSAPGVVRVLAAPPRRYLLKRERLATDRAATAAAAALAPGHTLPKVILLSEECGLIEYLEEHERLRDLIKEEVEVDALPAARRARNHELVLAPAAAEREYAAVRGRVPGAALRRAMERRSASVEDFLRKQEQFQQDLVSMTLVSWLLGLGDRHLNNIMYSTGDGGVRGVDWGALGQYGVRELPPARLTPQLLAVCTDGFEASLQRAVSTLREQSHRILPVLELAFQAGNCEEQFSTVEELILGRALPCDVTRRRIAASDVPHKQHYDKLLDDLRHVGHKHTYTVEEQVSNLLAQCTSPRVLAVTRAEWEPWL